MPAGAIRRADVLALHKRVFIRDQEVIDQVEEGTPLHDLVDSGSDVTDAVRLMAKIEGELMVCPVRHGTNPNRAVPFNSQTQGHPSPGKNAYGRLLYNITEMSQTIEVANLVQLTTSGNPQSVDDALALEADGMISGCRKTVSQRMHGNGSAMLATVAAGGWDDGSNTVTVNSTAGLEIGMELMARNKTTGAAATGHPTTNSIPQPMKVATIPSATTFTITNHLDADFVNASGATVYNAFGVYPYDAQGKAMWGIDNACSTTNPSEHGVDPNNPLAGEGQNEATSRGRFGGIDRTLAANAWWQGQSFTATALGGSDICTTSKHLAPILARINKRTGGAHGWLLGVTGFDVSQQIAADMSRQNRTNFTYELEGGWEALKYQNLWIVVDQDAVFTELKIFEPDATFMVIPEDWHFSEETGAMWNRKVDGLGRGMEIYNAFFMTRRQWLWGTCRSAAKITGFNAAL